MKIGIITMHRVCNFGSALQAYALQKYISDNICQDVWLIDYLYPNKEHLLLIGKSTDLKSKLIIFLSKIIGSFLPARKIRKRRFNLFYSRFFKLSDEYVSHKQILANPPIFDKYVTGSDQVWNPETMFNDGAFYLDFVRSGAIKFSFGSSFSNVDFSIKDRNIINNFLRSYSYIGIREHSGYDFVRSLDLNKNTVVENTCDPTLLLSQKEYNKIADFSEMNIEGEYILVYHLSYFDAEPAMSNVIRESVARLNCPVIHIGYRFLGYHGKKKYLSDIGPSEFVWLYKNAKIVITSSFHGTVFAVIYRKPFYSIVPNSSKENRSKDFLTEIGLENRLIFTDRSDNNVDFDDFNINEQKLAKYIGKSKNFLKKLREDDES